MPSALAADDPERQRISRIRVRNWNERVVQPDFRLAIPGFRNTQDRYLAFEFHISGRFLLVLSTTGAGSIWDLDLRAELPHPRRSGEAQRRCVQPRLAARSHSARPMERSRSVASRQ